MKKNRRGASADRSVAPAPRSEKPKDPLARNALGDDDLADPLAARPARTDEGTAEGQVAYEALLGEALGSKLYDAVAPHLTLDELSGYADEATRAAIEGVAGATGGIEGDIDQQGVEKFAAELSKKLGPMAAEWMKSESGRQVASKVGGWVDDNPEWIVTVALLAAAGAVVADMKIPELKRKFGLGAGTTAEVAAKVGSLRNIALQSVQAKLKHESGKLQASLDVSHDAEDGASGGGEVSWGSDEAKTTANARFDEEGLKVFGIGGLVKTAAGTVEGGAKHDASTDSTVFDASLTRKDGSATRVDSVKYDDSSGVLTLKQAGTAAFGEGGKVHGEHTTSSDGAQSAKLDVENQLSENLKGRAGVEHTKSPEGIERDMVAAGLSYDDKENLKADLEAKKGKGTASVKGSAEYQFDDDWKGRVHGKYEAGETTAYEAGAAVQYEDDLNKARAAYEYSSENQEHDAKLLGQIGVGGDTAVRGTAEVNKNKDGTKTAVGAHAAHFTAKDLGVIGGATYETDRQGKGSLWLEGGAQVNDVPIVIGVDPDNKKVRVGVKFSF